MMIHVVLCMRMFMVYASHHSCFSSLDCLPLTEFPTAHLVGVMDIDVMLMSMMMCA